MFLFDPPHIQQTRKCVEKWIRIRQKDRCERSTKHWFRRQCFHDTEDIRICWLGTGVQDAWGEHGDVDCVWFFESHTTSVWNRVCFDHNRFRGTREFCIQPFLQKERTSVARVKQNGLRVHTRTLEAFRNPRMCVRDRGHKQNICLAHLRQHWRVFNERFTFEETMRPQDSKRTKRFDPCFIARNLSKDNAHPCTRKMNRRGRSCRPCTNDYNFHEHPSAHHSIGAVFLCPK